MLSSLRWMARALWAVALAGLAYLAGLTLWLGLTGILFPYQLDYGEGFLLHFVRQLSRGQPIYKSIQGYPYITANYPPLVLVLALALTPLLGVTYAAGRVWTLLAVVACAAVIFAWVRREGRQWLPALAAALVFVGSPYIYHWAPLFRVDLVGLALTLGGLYAVWRAVEDRRPRMLWLAALLFVAGLYAKQSFLFAPVAALAYLFFFVDRWRAVKMAATVLVLGGGLFLLANALTGGGFWEGLVLSNVIPFLWPDLWQQLGDFFGVFAILTLLTVWYLVDKYWLDRVTTVRSKVSPLDLYLPAALVSLWFAGKAGAWENYFFEALAALTLGAGLGLARLDRAGRPGMRALVPTLVLAPLLLLAQVALMWHTPRTASRYLDLTRSSNAAMAPILAMTPDPIVSEDMGLLVTNGKVLDYLSFQYSQLARAGRWDQTWELDQLRGQALNMVILERGTRLDPDRYGRFTREFLSELDRNYAHTGIIGKYELYEPDRLQHQGRVDFADQLALVGWSVHAPPDLQPGDSISLTVVWQAQDGLAYDYTAFAHLVGGDGRGWAADDHGPYGGLYPTSAWGVGEMVRDRLKLTVPDDAPPGLYDVQVGWYPSDTSGASAANLQDRLPVGEGTAFRVAVLPVNWADGEENAPLPVGARFGETITLEGYGWQRGPDELQVTLRWSSAEAMDTDYTVFVHLVGPGEGEEVIAQGDSPPLGGRWPTSLWLPGVSLQDPHTIPLPEDLPSGTYRLLVGLYDPDTGERLPVSGLGDAVQLGEIDLRR